MKTVQPLLISLLSLSLCFNNVMDHSTGDKQLDAAFKLNVVGRVFKEASDAAKETNTSFNEKFKDAKRAGKSVIGGNINRMGNMCTNSKEVVHEANKENSEDTTAVDCAVGRCSQQNPDALKNAVDQLSGNPKMKESGNLPTPLRQTKRNRRSLPMAAKSTPSLVRTDESPSDVMKKHGHFQSPRRCVEACIVEMRLKCEVIISNDENCPRN